MKPVWMLFFTLLAFGTLTLSAQQQATAEQISCTPSPTCKPNPDCKPSPTCPPTSCCLTSSLALAKSPTSCGSKKETALVNKTTGLKGKGYTHSYSPQQLLGNKPIAVSLPSVSKEVSVDR